jgi:hypothetical protein
MMFILQVKTEPDRFAAALQEEVGNARRGTAHAPVSHNPWMDGRYRHEMFAARSRGEVRPLRRLRFSAIGCQCVGSEIRDTVDQPPWRTLEP